MKIIKKGFEVLELKERQIINRFIKEHFDKIGRDVDVSKVVIHLKEYRVEGSRRKYSIHILINVHGVSFEADYGGWELSKVLHKVCGKVSNLLESKFHLSDQYDKPKKHKRSQRVMRGDFG